MRKQLAGMGLLALLVACSSPEDVAAGITQGDRPDSQTALAAAAKPRQIEVQNDAVTFTYEWPAKVAAIKELNAVMEEQSASALAEYEGYAAEGKAGAQKYDYPFRPYTFVMIWKVAGETQGLLSLAGAQSSYTGGAHGNSSYDALVWDKAGQTAIEPLEIFASEAALEQALREPYCTRLRVARKERVGGVILAGADVFDACPPLSELAVVLVSGGDSLFSRIDLVAAPYVAGAYAEGAYTIELPVSDRVLDAVKPEYREAFTAEAD